MSERIEIESPWFEQLQVGQVFDDAPSVTLTSGHAAMHAALFADRMRLPLDADFSQAVTGNSQSLVNPSLVCNLAIGQTTYVSQRVRGNLFYRGLVLQRPVFIGDSLHTTTTVIALKQNRPKPGRAATGMVVLEMHVENQHGETVLHFWRCPMIPCLDPNAVTGHNDSFETIPTQLNASELASAVPSDWKLEVFKEQLPGTHFEDVREDTQYVVRNRDTVTSAPELVRMTLNMAAAHTDAGASPYGKRLVYGGHTISIAAAHLSRAFPNLVTLVAWRSCDHTAPVFEHDILRAEILVEATHRLDSGGGLLDLRVIVYAERGDQAPEPGKDIEVLDWRVVTLMA
jgi:2-methylfumaryl-CoA hydratase